MSSLVKSVVRMYPHTSYFSCSSGCWLTLNQLSKLSLIPKFFCHFLSILSRKCRVIFRFSSLLTIRFFPQNLPIWAGWELGWKGRVFFWWAALLSFSGGISAAQKMRWALAPPLSDLAREEKGGKLFSSWKEWQGELLWDCKNQDYCFISPAVSGLWFKRRVVLFCSWISLA